MKDKIIMFILGLLIGAIISTGSIYFYTIANNSVANNQSFGLNPPNMPNEQNNKSDKPPEMPNDNNMQKTNQANNN